MFVLQELIRVLLDRLAVQIVLQENISQTLGRPPALIAFSVRWEPILLLMLKPPAKIVLSAHMQVPLGALLARIVLQVVPIIQLGSQVAVNARQALIKIKLNRLAVTTVLLEQQTPQQVVLQQMTVSTALWENTTQALGLQIVLIVQQELIMHLKGRPVSMIV
eukprot:TRINITY_DN26630_c0_g1_i2.p4 TRINITY_DN26630_c0_g1~~TRINITY_DN26630_c0_g1_i2.p4  ORF type:complete len:163 (+),score=3.17 TRINITY_DN26630_c0_g1_i2:1328-1816(+)